MTAPRRGREDRGAAAAGRPEDPPSAAILDTAFRKAYRATPHGASRLDRGRRRAKLKMIRSAAVVLRHLDSETRPFRRQDRSPLEIHLLGRRFGEGKVDHSVKRVQRARERIRTMLREEEGGLARTSEDEENAAKVRQFYGRLASFVREVDPDLRLLRSARSFLRERPDWDPSVPTVVVAGMPNVGKSSLVARLSTAHPKVAAYPFTTQAIAIGHADLGFDRMQVMDTPGVLGRRTRANDAEVEAEEAVARAASVVLFVLDPSGACGYPMEEQEELLRRWKAEFPALTFIEVTTKSDLGTGSDPSGRLRVSAVTGEGLSELQARLEAALRPHLADGATPSAPEPGEWAVWPVDPERTGS